MATNFLWPLGCEAPKLCCGMIAGLTGSTPLCQLKPPCNQKILEKTVEALLIARMLVYYIDHNIYIVEMYIRGAYSSGVVRPKESYVPGPPGLLLRFA